ncbi:MAG: phage tail sheath subtilisin-like domain-containing protein [Chloroflexi bacterium]|nr:phage tail sheath subtilisin-like domain-containing protein [Chloroflexota bacterium]
MPVTPTFPGVYIEEVPSGVRTIVGVATSVTAFVGYFRRGLLDTAVPVLSPAEFQRQFGGLDAQSATSYAVQSFFLNGGSQAWVVRCAAAGTAVSAAIQLRNAPGGTAVLLATAANPGAWGDNIRIDVDYDTATPTATFNITVTELAVSEGRLLPVRVEVFRNLSLDSAASNYAPAVVTGGSKLVTLAISGSPAATARPAHTGTASAAVTPAVLAGLLAADAISVSLNGAAAVGPATLGAPVPATLGALATILAAKVQALDATLARVTVTPMATASAAPYLVFKAGTDSAPDDLAFTGTLATKLGLDAAPAANVQRYALGGAAKRAQALPGGGQQRGADGNPPAASDLLGDPVARTGIQAFEPVDLFNILAIPDTMNLSDSQAALVIAGAEAYCEARRAFYVVDVPQPATNPREEVGEIRAWLDGNATLRHKNAALYHPRPQIADPQNDYRLRAIASSGLMAGLFARTDTERGVWKAPAGTDAALRGVQQLEYTLTDAENGALNPLAINCLRAFPVYGQIAWGARTLAGADQLASEWKYIPVRRLALYLEESLYRGLKWVVFEPNDEPLWSQIRLNVGSFLHGLFRQGAFQGTTPREAYFVKCDKETTTDDDRNRGIVNILVGFAPLKPAEFVIIQIQQMAGQLQV